VPFFVLLSGSMDILQPDLHGERLIVTHNVAGHFTGELTMISGRRVLVLGRVTAPGEFLELSADELRSVIAKDAELSEILMRAFILRRLALISKGYGNLILMGSRHSAQTLRLREFLTRNGQPYTYVDLDTDAASQELLDRFHVTVDEIPVVICSSRNVMRNPSVQELADCLGFNASVNEGQLHDVIVVGAGPSGLAAAVYAASEGLDVLVIETAAPGGQAGSSSKIENYLGFPTGVSGQEAGRTGQQHRLEIRRKDDGGAQRFRGWTATSVRTKLLLDNGTALATRSIVISSGAQYNKPKIAHLTKFEGQGVYYGATFYGIAVVRGRRRHCCGRRELGGSGSGVHVTSGAQGLHAGTSGGIGQHNVAVSDSAHRRKSCDRTSLQTEIVGMDGDTHLEGVTWKDNATGETSKHPIRHVFVMTGASPRTDWLAGCLALDSKGFILTGRDFSDGAAQKSVWPLVRPPFMLETSLPGVFAVGDVRAGNVKRVASAVGEGAISIHMVHQVLAEA